MTVEVQKGSQAITDKDGALVELDPYVNSVPTTSTFHHLGHEGRVFIHNDIHSGIAAGANLNYLLRVPSSPTTRQVHLRFKFTVSDVPCKLVLYRDSIISAVGTSEVMNSTNDVVERTTGVELYEGPTITNLGNLWTTSLMTGVKNAGGTEDQIVPELILKAGVDYILRLTNNSNNAIDAGTAIFFYDTAAT